jgi:hypothetical protein
MNDAELANEVARRAGVSRADAAAILRTLTDMARERVARTEAAEPHSVTPYVPSARDVEDLIAAACRHPLGLEFLLEGHLGAVAIAFGTHAFTVDAARQRIGEDGAAVAGRHP